MLQTKTTLLVTVNVVPISLILVTLMMEAIRSSETSVLKRGTLHHIQEDSILQKVQLTVYSESEFFHCPFNPSMSCGF
jgi:hypothetical protein